MNPVATALLILGYALAMPILFRFTQVVERQQRLGLFGHEIGIVLAGTGWLARGQILVAVTHIVWIFIANLWFRLAAPQRRAN